MTTFLNSNITNTLSICVGSLCTGRHKEAGHQGGSSLELEWAGRSPPRETGRNLQRKPGAVACHLGLDKEEQRLWDRGGDQEGRRFVEGGR